MSDPPDLRDLIDDLPEPQRESLERADEVLRSVPAPPAELPPSLTGRVLAVTRNVPARSRRRAGLALALAAALAVAIAGMSFGVGYWLGGDDFEVRQTIVMRPTEAAPDALAEIKVGPRDDETGNWGMVVDVEGLPALPDDGYYVLWLAKDGEYAATCGTFNVGAGTTTLEMNASYRLADFDEWVISPRIPGDDSEPQWLLRASTT